MKELFFAGKALDELRSFPLVAKREAGFQMDRVQHGLDPNDWKAIKAIGAGVREIRIHCADGAYRVKDDGCRVCLTCFSKEDTENATTCD